MRGDIPDQWIEKEYRESYEAWCEASRNHQEALRACTEAQGVYTEAQRVYTEAVKRYEETTKRFEEARITRKLLSSRRASTGR